MDKTDMQILSHLMNNCRESNRQIGRDVGISGNAVNSRIKKMERSKVIEGYTIKIEPPALGYGIFYVVVSGKGIENKIEQIRLIGEPFFVVPCVGGITVCGIVVREEVERKMELAKNIMSGIRILTIFEAKIDPAESNLTRTDLEIIERLLPNPRKRIEEVSRETGLSTKTVTRSLDKLARDENIQFTTMYDPAKLANYIPYAVLTRITGDMKRIKRSFDEKFGSMYLQVPFLSDSTGFRTAMCWRSPQARWKKARRPRSVR